MLLGHVLAALAALELLPGGFPVSHPRGFAHRLAPLLLLALSLAVAALFVARPRAATGLLLGYPAGFLGLALGAALAFPETGGTVTMLGVALALLLGLGWVLTRSAFGSSRRWFVPAAAAGLSLGCWLSQCWRAPAPSTAPWPDGTGGLPGRGGREVPVSSVVQLAPWLTVHPEEARAAITLGELRVLIEPVLEFHSRSPDGFWTIFAEQRPEPPRLQRALRIDDALLAWSERPARSIHVQPLAPGGARFEAWSELEAPVYSHLNSFATALISGHARLGLRFSPCPDALVEVTYADYPFGAPARFAYLDERGRFRVVQAADAEKGPFVTLAEGPLARGAPLVVRLIEMGAVPARELGQIEFSDWSRQLSTELSPTAGYGVPQNALEFGLSAPHAGAAAHLILTLSGTGVGRGWDSVGHRPGPYRNRITLRPAAAPESASSP